MDPLPDPSAHPPQDVGAPEPRVLTREGARAIDRACVERFGLPTLVLMEHAAIRGCEVALSMLDEPKEGRVLIAAGTGSNGGDALAMARLLANAGARVSVLLAGESASVSGDAAVHLRVARAMGLSITPMSGERSAGDALAAALEPLGGEADLIIDGLLGTGLSRPVEGVMRDLIEALNAQIENGADALALDTPSGLDADTGEAMPVAVRADVTVTFAGCKAGFLALEAQAYTGEVVIADIGAPASLLAEFGAPMPPPASSEVGGREEDGAGGGYDPAPRGPGRA